MKKTVTIITVLILATVSMVSAGKILFYMPMTSKSMKITYIPLAEALAERGHEVTVLMPFSHKSKNEKLTIITVESKFEQLTER